LIAATNSRLDAEVEAGRFRGDLYFRINVVGFFLPPLRERQACIAPLAQKFFAELAARNRPDVCGMRAEVSRALEGYHWPGNIRELRNIIERAVALTAGPDIVLEDLPEGIRLAASVDAGQPSDPAGLCVTPGADRTLAQSRVAAEVLRIKQALAKNNNNRLRAAHELGISRMGLYKKLHKYGLATAEPVVLRQGLCR
jgi:DNA-binding NtrC family response regulator